MEGSYVAMDSDISTRGVGCGCVRFRGDCSRLGRNRQNFVLHLRRSLPGLSSQWAYTKGLTPRAEELLPGDLDVPRQMDISGIKCSGAGKTGLPRCFDIKGD